MEWLEEALGFERGQVHEEDGRIVHAELSYRGAWIMLGTAGEPADGDPFPRGPSTTYIAVDEVDSLHDRARDAGAEISMELTDQDYGSRDFAARDPEGNVWSFGTYRVNG
ncbi:MAG: VOC family protein [Actinomycetota bacterium]|nr:VOC family protein [Actinomycetota bacterium]